MENIDKILDHCADVLLLFDINHDSAINVIYPHNFKNLFILQEIFDTFKEENNPYVLKFYTDDCIPQNTIKILFSDYSPLVCHIFRRICNNYQGIIINTTQISAEIMV